MAADRTSVPEAHAAPSVPQLVSGSISFASGQPRVRLPLAALPALLTQQLAARDAMAESRAFLEGEAERRLHPGYPLIADHSPHLLHDAGWGVIVHREEQALILYALWPLIAHRLAERGLAVPDPPPTTGSCEAWRNDNLAATQRWLFLYDGRPCNVWLAGHHGLSSEQIVVDPSRVHGLPFYLLIVGRPAAPNAAAVPFSFQSELDLIWAVGRLCFTDAHGEHRSEAYRAYAKYVVEQERAARHAPPPPGERRVALFGPEEQAAPDQATRQLQEHLLEPLAARLRRRGVEPTELRRARATKAALNALLHGERGSAMPQLLVAAGRGIAYAYGDQEQPMRQGAWICQDWPGAGAPPTPAQLFSAEDLAPQAGRAGADLRGLIVICMICFSAGTSARAPVAFGAPAQVAPQDFVAQLPQRMLEQGALAVFAHVDETWPTMVYDLEQNVPRQSQGFSDLVAALLQGQRAGHATNTFNMQGGAVAVGLARQIANDLADLDFALSANERRLGQAWVRLADARSYLLLGDPAVRLWPPAAA